MVGVIRGALRRGTYRRPEFTIDGPLAIEDGRHPMLEEQASAAGGEGVRPGAVSLRAHSVTSVAVHKHLLVRE